MTVPPIDVTQFGTTAAPVRAPKQSMDGEVFLHLLVTQLANQDPSSPMDTNQMISQTTQLASMERMNTLSATQESSLDLQQRLAASSLIGREITTAGEPPITGVVTSVSFAGGAPVVTVGEQQIPYAQIIGIAAAAAPVPDPVQDTSPEVPPEIGDPESETTESDAIGA
jgi:flagellar basal-body rod modification protein FlgD